MASDDDSEQRKDPASLVAAPVRTWRTVVPIASWLPSYRWRRDLRPDVMAGITVAALLIPESMGYAGVAGVPPAVGLYAALGALVAYVITGGTSILVVGPAAAVAALSGSIVADLGSDANPVVLTAALALTSGGLLVVAGAMRLGWLVNFISRPVLHAFVAGLSISIIIGQLDGLLGVEAGGESAVAQLIDTLGALDEAGGWSVLVGVGALVALLLIERVSARVPAAIVVVVAGILAVVVFDLGDHGVALVGEIPQGLPSLSVPDLPLDQWLELLGGAAALLLVGFSEGYASASEVADATGEDVDGDQELLSTGVANLAAGVVGGMAVSGSLSKSEAAETAGARSQLANAVAATVVIATLLFLAPLFERLPEPVLAAVVIAAVLGSADPRRVVDLWRVNRLDFVAGAVTFTLVIVWETLPAMLVGVALSLAFLVHRATFPDVVELREGRNGVYDAAPTGPETIADERMAVMRFEAPLIYANATRFERAARRLGTRPGLERLVLDAEMIGDLDATGAAVLEVVDDDLTDAGVELHLARVHRRARKQIDRSHLARRFAGRVHATVRDAVEH